MRTDDQTSVSGVAIYINGKIADENIFKHQSDGRIPNAYLIGEVDAFSLDKNEDPVLSGREGLNHELEEVKNLKNELSKIRNELIDNWNEMRSKKTDQDYIEKILQNPVYKNTYDTYTAEEKSHFKKLAQKIFDKPKDKNAKNNDEEINILAPAIMQIVNDKVLNSVSIKLGVSEQEILSMFAKLFNVAQINHALRIHSNVKNRLNIIRELEKYIKNEEVEKVFEKHLAANPWLINPAWEIKGTKVSTQNKWAYLNINNEEIKLRTDIIVETSQDRFPIIVEIKRSKKTNYSCPDVAEIRKQINQYREIMVNEINKKENLNIKIYNIKAFFICGKSERDKLSESAMSQLQSDKIDLVTYDDLLDQARSMYSIFDADYDSN